MKTVVVGGGPAGMLAAISAARCGDKVVIIEKMNSLGKKLLITGKGRCNLTSSLPMDEFIKNIPGNGMFLYSAFSNFTNEDIIKMLKDKGLNTKNERGNRVFPVTDKAQDVLNVLLSYLKDLNVEIKTNTAAKEIIVDNEMAKGIKVLQNGKEEDIFADKIIVATGGASYPVTGSTGDGYRMLEKLGHTVTKIRPSLIPLSCYEQKECQDMQGLSLKNVKIKIVDIEKNKVIYDDFGEMLFTHFGISGPIVLSASSHILRYKNIDILMKDKKIKAQIDLKPALTEEMLDLRIQRDFEEYKNKQFKNSMFDLLPRKIVQSVIDKSKIDENKQVNEITKEERRNLVKQIKSFELTLKDFRLIEEAIITAGGINVKEINPKTMESKIIKGLFIAGELIDVDAYTGGFNLQIAYSTGYTAGKREF